MGSSALVLDINGNIERVPGMDETEKKRLVAEAKCLIAARYFDLFRHYGGLPLIYASFPELNPVIVCRVPL